MAEKPALPMPVPSLPTSTKEFLRWGLYVSGTMCIELFTGLVSTLSGLPIKVPVNHWQALGIFVFLLGAFAAVDAWQRAGHLGEQVRVAEKVSGGSVPPPPA